MKAIVLFYNSDFKSVIPGKRCGARLDLYSIVEHDLKLMEGLSDLKDVIFLADEYAKELEKLVSGQNYPFPIQVIKASLDQFNPFQREFLSMAYSSSQEGEIASSDETMKKVGPSSLLVIHSHLYMSRSCLAELAGGSNTSILSVLPQNGQTVVTAVSTERMTNPCFGHFTSAEGIECYPALKIVGEDIARVFEKSDVTVQKLPNASPEAEKEQTVEWISLCNVSSDCVFDLGDKVQRGYAEKAGWIFFREREIMTISYADLLMKSLDEFITWNRASRAAVVVGSGQEEETPAMRAFRYFQSLPVYICSPGQEQERFKEIVSAVKAQNCDLLISVGSAQAIRLAKRVCLACGHIRHVVLPDEGGILEAFRAFITEPETGEIVFSETLIPSCIITGILDCENRAMIDELNLRLLSSVVDGVFTDYGLHVVVWNFLGKIQANRLLNRDKVRQADLVQAAKIAAVYESIFTGSDACRGAICIGDQLTEREGAYTRFWLLTGLTTFLAEYASRRTYAWSRKQIADALDEVCAVLGLNDWEEIGECLYWGSVFSGCPVESLTIVRRKVAVLASDISRLGLLLTGEEFLSALNRLWSRVEGELLPAEKFCRQLREEIIPACRCTPWQEIRSFPQFYEQYHRAGAKLHLQQVQSRLMSQFKSFCDSHRWMIYLLGDTRYSIARSGELFPYSDQVSVAMSANDISQMISHRNEMEAPMGLYVSADDGKDCFPGARIYARDTRWERTDNLSAKILHKEIYIQVLPIYWNAGESFDIKRYKRAQYLGLLIERRTGKKTRSLGYKGKIANVMAKPIPVAWMVRMREALMKRGEGGVPFCDRGITGLPSRLEGNRDTLVFAGQEYCTLGEEILWDGSRYVPKACLSMRPHRLLGSTCRIAVPRERTHTLAEPELKIVFVSPMKKAVQKIKAWMKYGMKLISSTSEKLKRCWKKKKPAVKGFLRTQFVRVTGFFRGMGICISPQSRALKKYRNKYAGQRCFLIGNGPSLRAEDLDMLQGEITFACNFIHKIYGQTAWRPTFHCISDSGTVRTASWDIVRHLDQNKTTMLIREFAYKFMAVKPDHAVLIPYVSTPHYKVHGNFLAYHYISHATVMSMMLEAAMYMGFREIYLLGVDATTSSDKGGNFSNNYFSENVRKRLDALKKRSVENYNVLERRKQIETRQRDTYGKIQEYAAKHGYKIYNATRGGALEAFERVDFDLVISKETEG